VNAPRRVAAAATVFLLLSLSLTACRSHSEAAEKPPLRSLKSGGLVRSYRVYRPLSLSKSARPPLVIMLHAAKTTAALTERLYGWDASADAGQFIVAYPDGVSQTWNAGTCCGPALERRINDVGFIRRMIDDLAKDDHIDRTRVYVAGMSNGAILAYRLACELRHAIAAIGPVAGTMTVECTGATPTSVFHIHGLDDPEVPYEGGVGTSFARAPLPSIPATIERWRTIDGCGPLEESTSGRVHTQTSTCRHGTTVRLVTVDGHKHSWPGVSILSRGGQVSPDAGAALNATSVLWQFFSSKSL